MPKSGSERWFKGNTHTHTNQSDGDSTPEEVIAWYRAHGYNFLALSDHNLVVDCGLLRSHERRDFILIPGEEISVNHDGTPIHLNALGVSQALPPLVGGTKADTLRDNLAAVLRAGGLGHVNHPNFRFALTSEDMLPVENLRFLEIYNGHPAVYNDGDETQGCPSVETMWDDLLSSGQRVYGLAVDDAHHFAEFDSTRANPGRGYVMVRAQALSPAAILCAIVTGDFYASTGLNLSKLTCTPERISLEVHDEGVGPYLVEFVGRGGEILESVAGPSADYVPVQGMGYVRARVRSAGWARCWTQPVFA